MNILFITDKNVDPLIGGIERMTYALASTLIRVYGDRCLSMYTRENDKGTTSEGVFADKRLIPDAAALTTYLRDEQIDILVAQGSAKRVHHVMPLLREAVDRAGRGKIVFVFHNMPGQELINRPWYWKPFMPIFRRLLREKYAIPYRCSDKVLVLCEGYIDRYADLARCGREKLQAQGNALSFADVKMSAKKKTVLMVTRLEERQKRVSAAIRIWREIEKDSTLSDWEFKIVGYGPDEVAYHKQAAGLNRLEFVGFANPVPYYEEASIFLMSSAYEGFPMTILEAQQHGCVPVAFDSFEAVRDCITDEKDGFIVQDNDYTTFIQRLKLLMHDTNLLRGMAEEARRNCRVHNQEEVASSYRMCFSNILS